MIYNEFGKLGFDISRFGIGCMRLPLEGVSPAPTDILEEEAIKMIRHGIDNGVKYIDTAYPYHGGKSELVVAKALKDGYREKVKLATKSPVWLVNKYDDFDKYLNEQLKKLETDHLDFYLLHALDKERWNKVKSLGALQFLDKAKKSGKIKHAGFSFHDNFAAFKEIIDSYHWDMCQIQLNFLDEHNQAGVEGLKYAGAKGIAVVIMEPLRGGKLARNIPQDIAEIWDKAEVKRSPAEWAFRWLMNFPEVKVILSGVSSMEQLNDNLRIFDRAESQYMSEKDLELVQSVKAIYDSRIKVKCTACKYCVPCPSGVSIPDIFGLYNDSSMFETTDGYTMWYQDMIKSGNDASRCIECGRCQRLCPQGIEIIQKLKDANSALIGK